MNKSEQRQYFKALRGSLQHMEKCIYDNAITQKILSLPQFKNAESILLFYSVGSEFDTGGIFRECIKNNKKVYFPKCLLQNKMEFYRVTGESDFASGKYNIPEPVSVKNTPITNLPIWR